MCGLTQVIPILADKGGGAVLVDAIDVVGLTDKMFKLVPTELTTNKLVAIAVADDTELIGILVISVN